MMSRRARFLLLAVLLLLAGLLAIFLASRLQPYTETIDLAHRRRPGAIPTWPPNCSCASRGHGEPRRRP